MPKNLTACPECGKLFRGETGVRMHMKTQHPELLPPKTEEQSGVDDEAALAKFELKGGDVFLDQEGRTMVFLNDMDETAMFARNQNATVLMDTPYHKLRETARTMTRVVAFTNVQNGNMEYLGNVAENWGK